MARKAKPDAAKAPAVAASASIRASTGSSTKATTEASTDPTPSEPAPAGPAPLAPQVLDELLSLQLLIAWAGEGQTDPPRLGWWRTSLVDEFGGEDLFKRLTPRTWRWAVFEAARVAARSVDADARARAAEGDQLLSLFHFGFAIDEQLDDRLSEFKCTTPDPLEALPELGAATKSWDAAAFLARIAALATPAITDSSVGRRLKGERPADPLAAARLLAAAMAPMSARYPAPHFKVEH